MRNRKPLFLNGYGNRKINLADEKSVIGEDCALVVVAGPVKDFSQKELSRLQLFLDGRTRNSEAGRVRLVCDAAAITFRDETISACVIDSVQADVPFDAMGTITTDVTGAAPTKTELGDDYGMKAYGGAAKEWFEQADAFDAQCEGKTGAEIAALIAADGKGNTDVQSAGCTIYVSGLVGAASKI